MILGAGAGGVAAEFAAFGDPAEAVDRAAMLDEGLDVVARLWSGRPVTHAGRFCQVNGVTLAPLPVQRPRVPVWIGGASRAARRRAARWDGWVIGCDDEQGHMVVPPARIAASVAEIAGPGDDPFDIAVIGASTGAGDPVAAAYAAAGATWWLEHVLRAARLARKHAGAHRRGAAGVTLGSYQASGARWRLL